MPTVQWTKGKIGSLSMKSIEEKKTKPTFKFLVFEMFKEWTKALFVLFKMVRCWSTNTWYARQLCVRFDLFFLLVHLHFKSLDSKFKIKQRKFQSFEMFVQCTHDHRTRNEGGGRWMPKRTIFRIELYAIVADKINMTNDSIETSVCIASISR